MRVYFGTTYDGLRELYRTSSLGPAPLLGHAVTPALRESYAEGDTEELEYVALTAAALDSLRMLAKHDCEPRRRAVVAADVPDAAVTALHDNGPSAVDVSAVVPLAKVDAIHVDDPQAEGAVDAALSALEAGGAATVEVEDVQAEDLMWFATQELPFLLA